VERILEARRFRKLGLAELRRLKIPAGRAAPFLLCAGQNDRLRHLDTENLAARFRPPPRQLGLFDVPSIAAAVMARTGEL